ncbi:conserved hypothetical protein [Hyella patelloides LEGE 07179]|uniref:CRISPR-associated protein Csc2 n=1 Tax=Hyella patelloides LEGE 07179 TaxID=945734 RepID=A0A563VRG7_9CYAN|nr:hypothetical protein [Hyella patelloides]VEP13999.1 conserved hypothetical protein [Hyella patelloides LEGE 07179]
MTTGLPKTNAKNPRLHFDIYVILEGAQELYFGHETQVNVNLVEKIKMLGKDGQALEKCYLSPTKRRGVERRCLLWSPVKSGELLGDKQKCGIPKTCASPECPICSTYGALDPGKKTLIGRVTHGGGVAVQDICPVKKQRAMHPAMIVNQNEETPQPYKRQYNQPGILYPVYNHALSLTDNEFAAVAYAFLDSLPRIGAGNPKGISIAESDEVPLLVLDRYLVPQKKRPIISPAITDPQYAIADFKRLGNFDNSDDNYIEENHFERWIGDSALTKLQEYATNFVDTVLQA